jgi:methionyl aminopeptidase
VTIRSEAELRGLRRAGAVVAETLRALERAVEPGVSTGELDALCARELARRGAEPTPARTLGFPGAICISVDDEAVHGVPGARRVAPGEARPGRDARRLRGRRGDHRGCGAARARRPQPRARGALASALATLRAGLPIRALGRAIERSVRRAGFRVIREVGGHGVGRALHEEPHLPNFDEASARGSLHEGLVVAIEPVITTGEGTLQEDADGWTLRTRDCARVAHAEHTVVVTRGMPIVVTA